MLTKRRSIGDYGEKSAEQYLQKKKYKILRTNAFFLKKEVDIIAENREFLVFAEVKTRTLNADGELPYGRPATAVDRAKRQNLITAARMYLAAHKTEKKLRFDVIEVYLPPEGNRTPPHIIHMEDAFRA